MQKNINPKIALCLIVKGSDQEAEVLDRALNYTSPHVDGVFITQTQKNKKIKEIAEKYKANLSYFEWCDDYAKARNFNFDQVDKEYTHILWMDADDLFRGIDSLRESLKQNPDTGIFTMNYLYWFDKNKNPVIVHLKTQVVKNDGCVKWRGKFHEDFEPQRKDIKAMFLKDIERLHLTTEERIEQSKERNLRIAKKQMKEEPNDPRSYWNLARAQASLLNEEAINTYREFIKKSRSEEEKYLARMGIAGFYFDKRNYSKALDETRYAIGIKPEYPNAYILAGHIYFYSNNLEKAKDMYGISLTKKPPVSSILVWNPREYDYVPLMSLAKVYFSLNLPTLALDALKACQEILPGDKKVEKMIKAIEREAKKFEKMEKHLKKLQKIKNKKKLKKALDKLPDDMKSHPGICHLRNLNFIKESSSGKDLVIYCAYTEEEWTPETVKEKGIGGSEEAVINISRELQKKGWNVTVYNNCGYKEKKFDGVKYKPFWSWNYRDKQDVAIIWRHPKALDYPVNTKKIYLDMHDVLPESEFTPERLNRITKIMVKSKAQRELFPNIPDNKFCIIPNGVDPEQFKTKERDPYLLVNFSSPDRSLQETLDIYERVLKKVPKSIKKKLKFAWYYGWQVFDTERTAVEEQEWKKNILDRIEKLKKKGLAEGGYRISHEKVADLLSKAGALFYPSDFYEIDFVGGTKAQMAGCIPITTDFAAMDEKIKFGIKIPSKTTKENWANVRHSFGVKDEKTQKMFERALLDYLKNVDKWDKKREDMKKWAKEEFNISKIAELWDKEFKKEKSNIILPYGTVARS